jgi:UDP-glucose 4-epimerase
MNIILTGSTGLIGAKVAEVLKENHCLYTLGRRQDAVNQLFDLTSIDQQHEFSLPKSEWLIHCAGIIDEDFKSDNPSLGFQKAVFGLESLLKKAISAGIKNFIYISTTHIYGVQAGLISESSPPNPLTTYSMAHFCSEQLFKKYSHSTNGRLIILRPNAVYGIPKYLDSFQRWSLIPFSFPQEAKQNGKIILKSSGNQKRNFVSIQSIANLISRLVDGDLIEYQGFINVLGAHTESVYDFALRCKNLAMNSFQIECEVERPLNYQSIPDADIGSVFELTSAVAQNESPCELDEYIKTTYGLL